MVMDFINCIPSWEINEIILYTNIVAVKCEFNCHCYNVSRNCEYFICRTNKVITKRDLLNCLIENEFNPGCDHYFLEHFQINTESQVTAFFGS
jgi:hypothetical protein